MSVIGDGKMHVFILNVGQADTTIIFSPKGKVIIIDATRPAKILDFLHNPLFGFDNTVEHLIITHPHDDHFSGGNRLSRELNISEATVAPFWHEFGMGPPTYRRLIERLDRNGTNVSFLSGLKRWYPR